jgi:hypothetical protein
MNERIKEQWISALTSGEFTQNKRALKRDGAFCCLGVLCELHARETGNRWENSDRYLGEYAYLPQEVIKWAELKDKFGSFDSETELWPRGIDENNLSIINDDGDSFATIAEIIKEKF